MPERADLPRDAGTSACVPFSSKLDMAVSTHVQPHMHLLVVIQPAWLVEMDDGKRMHLLACLLACSLLACLRWAGWLAGVRNVVLPHMWLAVWMPMNLAATDS